MVVFKTAWVQRDIHPNANRQDREVEIVPLVDADLAAEVRFGVIPGQGVGN